MVKITELVMPFGKGFAAVSVRKLIDDMAKRYSATIEPEINVMAFKEKKDYFIYARVPSRTNDKYGGVDKIFYDVVLQLIPPNGNMERNDTNIRNWDVKVFNNNPSFMFTFDFAFNNRRALINLPNGYYGRIALKQKPKVRNPMMLLGLDEDIWFTIMYCDKNHWFERDILDSICNSSSIDFKWIVKQITPQEEKLKEVQDRSLRQRNQAKKEKELEKLTKNEKEREKEEEKENTPREGHAKSSESMLNGSHLRMTNFNDLSSNLTSSNSGQLSKKSNLNKSKLGKSGLRSKL